MFHLYGLFIGIGILAGLWIAGRQAIRFGQDPKQVEDALLWVFVPAVIGARAYHVLTDWNLYVRLPATEIIAVWNGGLGIYGALLGGVMGMFAYTYRRWKQQGKMSLPTFFFTLADLYVFGIPLGQAIGRLGNYVNTELYGSETNLPWGIVVGGNRYHPLFAYEATLLLMLFAVLIFLSVKKALVLGKGQYTALYFAGYGLIRFWLEFLREDSARFDGSLGVFTIAQWISVAFIIAATIIFWTRRHAVGVVKPKEWDFSLD